MTQTLAIIGGTGLDQLPGLQLTSETVCDTPYGAPSAPLQHGTLNGKPIIFLARHGTAHNIPPHCINYRANFWALKDVGINSIIAVNAVGGIRADLGPAELCVPDQIIDYTHSRQHTYSDSGDVPLHHADFTEPYTESLRQTLLSAALAQNIAISDHGVHGVVQGPRLETIAEINKMERDGADMIGMTGMPEAGLARELELGFACLAVSVNWVAGRGNVEGGIHAEMAQFVKTGMEKVHRIFAGL